MPNQAAPLVVAPSGQLYALDFLCQCSALAGSHVWPLTSILSQPGQRRQLVVVPDQCRQSPARITCLGVDASGSDLGGRPEWLPIQRCRELHASARGNV